MYKLNCGIQKYDWGRIGTESSVAVFKSAQDTSFEIDPNVKYAELWMGTHPRGPSQLQITQSNYSINLSDYLKSNGDLAIGEQISAKFYNTSDGEMKYGDLPFLFKVLSINKALSIQAHPNKTLARKLHANDPKNYPDANHKPEMLIAISEKFEAMCGFRVASEIANHFEKYTELKVLCGEKNCDEFIKNLDAEDLNELKKILADCLRSLMSQKVETIKEQFDFLSTRLAKSNKNELTDLEQLYTRLAGQYPNDVGCFVVFLLNCFILNKGEAIYLAANIPHAYLFGDGIECMACSDNVVRAGLTPKFKDVDTLCEMLDYTMRSANDNKLQSTKTEFSKNLSYLSEFRPTVDEFSIQEIRLETTHLEGGNKMKFLIPKSESGSILILVEVNTSESSFFEAKNKKDELLCLNAKVGLVYFIDANTDIYYNVVKVLENKIESETNNVLLAYRAYCDIKN